MKHCFLVPVWLFVCAGLTLSAARSEPATHTAQTAVALWEQLPLAFEPNVGQAPPDALFVSRGKGYAVSLCRDAILVGLERRPRTDRSMRSRLTSAGPDITTAGVAIRFSGVAPDVSFHPAERLPGVAHYYYGRDAGTWHTHVPRYARVEARGLYPGIDLAVYGNPLELEFDLVVAPGADPHAAALEVTGGECRLQPDGSLSIATAAGALILHAPVAYQIADGGQRRIPAEFVLAEASRVSFRVGEYDKTLPLVIDPVLSYSTYIGGSGTDEVHAIAVDASGRVYVTGSTTGSFPTKTGSYDVSFNGVSDVFITKLNPTAGSGSAALVFSTYLGGSGEDEGNGIVVDSSGRPVVCGVTASNNFPSTKLFGPQGGRDAFIVRLNSTGSAISYAVIAGGTANDFASGIALDASGNAYITGLTGSSNFPVSGSLQPYRGAGDAYVLKYRPTSNDLGYSTFVGGTLFDEGIAIAVDADGGAIITGDTDSTNFPLQEAFQTVLGGTTDAFLTRVRSDASRLSYSTFLGGTGFDIGYAVAVDAGFNPVVTGETRSSNFPLEKEYDSTYAGGPGDAFVTRFGNGGDELLFSTYLGGSGVDRGLGVAYGRDGSVFVAGETNSDNFPTVSAYSNSRAGSFDPFLTRFASGGKTLIYSTYAGGTGDDKPFGLALDSFGRAWLGGATTGGFPTAGSPYQSTYGGNTDGFISLLAPTVRTFQQDVFTSANIQPPGSATGWSVLASNPGLADADYSAALKALRGVIAPDASRFRIAGWISNASEWLPYAQIGTSRFVRAKYYLFTGGQSNPSLLNTIPNLRVRTSLRFAQNSMLEVFHHANGDPANATLARELRPSSDPTRPSLYRVDMDPVDVPYLAANSAVEGVLRAMEAYALDPQDNGYIAMSESIIGSYAATALPSGVDPVQSYNTSDAGAGSLAVVNPATELDLYCLILGTLPGEFGTRDPDPATTKPSYWENSAGVTLDATSVATDRVGIGSREFNPGASQTARARVREGRQYLIRWHVTSTQLSNRNAGLRLRGRTAKFAWSQKLELGGAWATGSGLNANNSIAQQLLPGIGCQNPSKIDNENGGWYNMFMHTPMSVDIRPDVAGVLSDRMPNLSAQPGPGANAASRRDLLLGADLVDSISGGTNAGLERGNFTVDRIDVYDYPLVDD
ncbi:MAG: SBBP repeat-containing protein [Candidatus Sumerlaeaceae bacterium]|nr:SBBP repeat-containing protein [Candidatus Sumerlaeaceae bacterium]